MYRYEVGKPYIEGVTSYPESVKFNFTQGGAILLLFYNNPTEEELAAVKKGRLEVRFHARGSIIFFLARFGSLPWLDAPYTVHLSKPFEFQEMAGSQGFGMHITLIDARTGVIRAMRLVGLSHGFSRELQAAIEAQRAMPFDEVRYDHELSAAYRNYRTRDLVKMADARCLILPREG